MSVLAHTRSCSQAGGRSLPATKQPPADEVCVPASTRCGRWRGSGVCKRDSSLGVPAREETRSNLLALPMIDHGRSSGLPPLWRQTSSGSRVCQRRVGSSAGGHTNESGRGVNAKGVCGWVPKRRRRWWAINFTFFWLFCFGFSQKKKKTRGGRDSLGLSSGKPCAP